MPQNLKGHGDAQTYDSANIEFLQDFHPLKRWFFTVFESKYIELKIKK